MTCCPVVELRQYTLKPGQRDVLVELFDREFVESQEALGVRILGQFRDLDRPERYVWLRGFTDMAARGVALGAFYGGPVWKAHRDAANATMLAWDDVLLLRPADAAAGFALKPRDDARPRGIIAAVIHHLAVPATAGFSANFEATVVPRLVAAGLLPLARFVTESAANTFPALPVREGEQVFVWFVRFAERAALDVQTALLAQPPRWQGATLRTEVLKLEPTPRSLLR